LIKKETKKSSLNIFIPKIIGRISYRDPAARVSHSTRGLLPSANAEILTVIFWFKNIRAIRASCCDYYFYLKIIFFVLITHELII
jgi:hypothetical protein